MSELWHPAAPGFDCLIRGHLWVEHHEGRACASWCLWCGAGVSNEHDEPDAWRAIYGPDWEPPRCDPWSDCPRCGGPPYV